MTQSFFITGASGWLGRRIVDELRSGNTRWLNGMSIGAIHILLEESQRDLEGDFKSGNIEVTFGDVRVKADCDRFLEKADDAIVIHTAGIIHPKRVSDFYAINLSGTLNIFNSATARSAKRVVVMSSNSPVGVSNDTSVVFDEKSGYRPYMGYGRSKMEMEKALLKSGLPPEKLIIIRAPWFYGPGQPPRQTLFFKMVEQGKFPLLAGGIAMRSMSYIDNLVQGVLRAASHPAPKNNVYWIADRRPYSMKEVVQTVEKVLFEDFGKKVKGRQPNLPGFIGTVAEKIDAALQSLGIYQQKMHVLSEMNKTIACSIDQAERELNYAPEIELREGMKRSVQWCKEQNLI